MTTLQDLFRRVPAGEVLDAFFRLYPDENVDGAREALERVLDELGDTEPAHTSLISSVIVDLVELDRDRPWVNVSGLDPGYDGKCAIELSPWAEWLPATVIRGNKMENASDAEILAHILWEMTWWSCDQAEIAKKRAVMMASVDELRNEVSDAETKR